MPFYGGLAAHILAGAPANRLRSLARREELLVFRFVMPLEVPHQASRAVSRVEGQQRATRLAIAESRAASLLSFLADLD